MALPKTKLKTPTTSIDDGDIEVEIQAKAPTKAPVAVAPIKRNNHIPVDMTNDELYKANILTEAQSQNGVYPHPVQSSSVDHRTITREVLTEKGWIVPSKGVEVIE